MRTRSKILASLDATYREAFERAEAREDEEEMLRLDFQYQKDQLQLEALLDIRDLLAGEEPPVQKEASSLLKEGSALLEKAQVLKRVGRLR